MIPLYHDSLIPPTKVCTKCQIEKPLSQFSKANTRKIGYKAECKACCNIYNRNRKSAVHPISVLLKTCAQCHIEKSIESFHRYNKSADGHKHICKECKKVQHQQEYRQKHPISKFLPPATNGIKICRTCQIEKPIDQFYKDKRSSDGLGTQCKACVHYREQVVNHDQTLARTRAHWDKNRQKYMAQHEEWRKANLLKCNELGRRRTAREKAATIGEVNYKRILERDGYWCYICEKEIDPTIKGLKPGALSFDHVIPLARGGSHAEDNLKPAHKTCNSRKGTKLFSEMTTHQRRGIV